MPTRTTTSASRGLGIERNNGIIDLLITAYNAEIETLANYISAAMNINGIRAERIREELLGDVTAELGHAQKLAARIRVLGGSVPGSQQLRWEQNDLQPSTHGGDVRAVIQGVIKAEEQAIKTYQEIIDACEGVDYVTQDLAITLLADEQEHYREFVGFLKEYER